MAEEQSAPDIRRKATDCRILAGVVAFHPDPSHLRELVETLRMQVAGVMLFLNSPIPDDLCRHFAAVPDVSLIEASSNLGVGVALNVLSAASVLQGASALTLFDQDSTPSSRLVEQIRRSMG